MRRVSDAEPPGCAPEVRGLVDHLFRHEFGRLVATLTRIFGPARMELAEDVAQEALLRALRVWSLRGVPEAPGAWLQRVAQNLALDSVRREARFADKEAEIHAWAGAAESSAEPVAESGGPESDDTRSMLFLCCHEVLPRESQIALSLKTIGGFGVAEIARAFLAKPATIAQRLVRAKARLREPGVRFELPGPEVLLQRLDAVLDVIYLAFNEGYECCRGESLVRRDLIDEALRWGRLLLAHAPTARPEVHALQALMLFQASRLDARVGATGELLLLEEQDRRRWNRGQIAQAFAHLAEAMEGEGITRFHLQAGIASCHAQAPSLEGTDWPRILAFYDHLVRLAPSPVVELNRSVALAMVDGPLAGLAALEPLVEHSALADYPLLDAVRGELLRRSGCEGQARECFERARAATESRPVRALLSRKIGGLGDEAVEGPGR